jgi:hypothetical protein
MATGVRVALHDVHDFVLESSMAHANPFLARVSASFEHDSGMRIENVPGFYDGQGRWVIRFSPIGEGRWRGWTSSGDRQLDGISLGPILCAPNENRDVHGRVQVDQANRKRFRYEDGRPFIPLGFEWDWLFAYGQVHLGHAQGPRNDNPSLDEALGLLKDCGFNVIVANLYAHRYHRTELTDATASYLYGPPPIYVFGGTNDAPDHARLNVEFFRSFDRVLAALHRHGLILHLMIQVQNKAVQWPARNSPEDDLFWQYVVARYQAYPNVIWDIGKECYNLLRQTGSHDYVLGRISLIRRTDAYGHLVTAHDTERESWGGLSQADAACDFISDQVKFRDAVSLNREAIRRFRNTAKPYFNIEYLYEKGVEDLPTVNNDFCRSGRETLVSTWAIYAGGAYANYYYCNTSWDLIKFKPAPESWRQYRYLRDFLEKMDLGSMVPDNDFLANGMCSAEPGRQYFIFLSEGGNAGLDLAAMSPGAAVRCGWLDVLTGQRAETIVRERKFRASLANPLTDPSHPAAIHVQAIPAHPADVHSPGSATVVLANASGEGNTSASDAGAYEDRA